VREVPVLREISVVTFPTDKTTTVRVIEPPTAAIAAA
jgi:hypothetical protein